tara:strand:- start:52 stop:252 length:201 start_codon:yes stop_codon:yes gene_type:complete
MYKGLTVEQTTKVVKMLSDFGRKMKTEGNLSRLANGEDYNEIDEVNKIITYILREDLGNATGLNES